MINYTEVSLDLLKGETKTIKLKEFFSSNVATEFLLMNKEGKEDKGELAGFKMNEMKTIVFDTSLLEEKDAKEFTNIKDMVSGVSEFYSMQKSDEFVMYRIYVLDDVLTEQKKVGTIAIKDFKPLFQMTDNQGLHIYIFQNKDKYHIKPCSLNKAEMIQLQCQISKEYQLTEDAFKNRKEIHTSYGSKFYFLAYEEDKSKFDWKFLECFNKNTTSHIACKRGNFTFKNSKKENFDLVGIDYLEETPKHTIPRVRLFLSAKQSKSTFSFTDCERTFAQYTVNYICHEPKKIENKIPSTEPNIHALSLGKGHIGFLTKHFFTHSEDLSLKKFQTIYKSFKEDLFKEKSNLRIISAEKNKNFILMTLSNLTDGRITSYYVMEHDVNPPQATLEEKVEYLFLKMKDEKLLSGKNKTDEQGVEVSEFGDAYLKIRTKLFENMSKTEMEKCKDKNNPSIYHYPFQLVSKVNKITTFRKKFEASLLTDPLNTIKLNFPFTGMSVIRNSNTSLIIKQNYVLGSNLSVTLKDSNKDLNFSIEETQFFDIDFQNDEVRANKRHIIKMILLHDNILLVANNDSKSKTSIAICYLQLPKTLKPSGKSSETSPVACKEFVFIPNHENYVVEEAQLMNKDTVAIVYKILKPKKEGGTEQKIIQLFNISPEYRKTHRSMNVSEAVFFETTSRKTCSKCFILYTYQASTILVHSFMKGETNNSTTQTVPSLGQVYFKNKLDDDALGTDRYIFFKQEIKIDRRGFLSINALYPDYLSKNYILVEIRDSKNITEIIQIYILEQTNAVNNQEMEYTYKMVPHRQLPATVNIRKSNGNFVYCMTTNEIGIISKQLKSEKDKKDKVIHEGVFDSIVSIPFSVKDRTYERMVRPMPLKQIGLDYVYNHQCLNSKDSIIALGVQNFSSPKFNDKLYLVNYDFSQVNEPRSRLQRKIPLPKHFDVGTHFLTVSAHDYRQRDSIAMSYEATEIEDPAEKRQFVYVRMPVKDIALEIDCRHQVGAKVNLDLEFKVDSNVTDKDKYKHGTKKLAINVEVRPLDFSTKIFIRDDKKLTKEIGTVNLEAHLLAIKGHFLGAQLKHVPTNISTENYSVDKNHLELVNRIRPDTGFEKSLDKVKASIKQVEALGDYLFVLQENGTVAIFGKTSSSDKKSQELNFMGELRAQAEYMSVGHFNVVWNKTTKSFEQRVYLFLGEPKRFGLEIFYYEFHKEPKKDIAKSEIRRLKSHIHGSPKFVTVSACGHQFYVAIERKDRPKISFQKFSLKLEQESRGEWKKLARHKSHYFNSSVDYMQAMCLKDSDYQDRDNSFGLIVIFRNNLHLLMRYNLWPKYKELTVYPLDFLEKDKAAAYVISDFECNLLNDQVELKQEELIQTFSTTFKCLYSTRWESDYSIIYELNTKKKGESAIKKKKVIEEIEEVKNFQGLRTIMNSKYAAIIGYNLIEPRETRGYHCLIYDFRLERTAIVGSVQIPKIVDTDPRNLDKLISISDDGFIYSLGQSGNRLASYDQVKVNWLGPLELKIKVIDFDPNTINIEVLGVDGEPLKKINLGSLFELGGDIHAALNSFLPRLMLSSILFLVVILIGSFLYYMMSQRQFLRAKKKYRRDIRGEEDPNKKKKASKRKRKEKKERLLKAEDSSSGQPLFGGLAGLLGGNQPSSESKDEMDGSNMQIKAEEEQPK